MSKVESKIFVGVVLTPEVKKHLQTSLQWKLAKFYPSESIENPLGIREVPFQSKEYFGTFLKEDSPSIDSIEATYLKVKQELLKFCEHLEDKKIIDAIFLQSFLNS